MAVTMTTFGLPKWAVGGGSTVDFENRDERSQKKPNIASPIRASNFGLDLLIAPRACCTLFAGARKGPRAGGKAEGMRTKRKRVSQRLKKDKK